MNCRCRRSRKWRSDIWVIFFSSFSSFSSSTVFPVTWSTHRFALKLYGIIIYFTMLFYIISVNVLLCVACFLFCSVLLTWDLLLIGWTKMSRWMCSIQSGRSISGYRFRWWFYRGLEFYNWQTTQRSKISSSSELLFSSLSCLLFQSRKI